MSEFFEIAYAAASKRLCLFTGTGFSKALTEGNVPGWQELIEDVCASHVENSDLKEVLFPEVGSNPLRLEEAAQIVEMDLAGQGKNLHEVIANNIAEIDISGHIPNIKEFFSERSFRIVTTNYDKLSEKLAGSDCQSLSPGMPVPKSSSRVKVFHVHGSVDYPPRMVVTADNYFNFMNSETYFSRKLSTVLHENTVVVLGYSLGDTNLKNILSDYSGFMKDHFVGSSIFFVSRSSVDQPIRDYYAACYGIRVIDNTDIEEFFKELNRQYPRAEKILSRSLKSVDRVLNKGTSFKDSFLKMEDSFPEIVSSLGAQGVSLESPDVVKMFGDIVKKKQKLCGESGAWEQYEHLASWLINLGSLIDIEGRSLEAPYLKAVKYSMEHMSKKKLLGYSWHAYKRWDAGWKNVRAANRSLIKSYILEHSGDQDAERIVSRG
ncbi:SIR2 family protein [Shimia thalassica]|uniref:SIR2 family NAD-dependent protein deacylase n=1 Tax=Shimia thalassica TaxID=1715693 RepID=UPI001C0A2F7C|nr:SIR2 family protein [Shimia thalassica]MBU2944585.1 SIR2 family protein [Shimia thalassica]MDO6502069.1 SIR2 family protein [Shimia thalassica]